MTDIGGKVVGFIAAIISLAVVALVISQRANTANVLTSFFSGLTGLIGVAISPVTGASVAGLSAAGLSTTGLTGNPTQWVQQIGTSTGTSAGLTSGVNVNLGNLGSSVGSLLSSIGGGSSGSGFVDSGSFDPGGGGDGGLIDSGSFS